jgi:hypothetical protein
MSIKSRHGMKYKFFFLDQPGRIEQISGKFFSHLQPSKEKPGEFEFKLKVALTVKSLARLSRFLAEKFSDQKIGAKQGCSGDGRDLAPSADGTTAEVGMENIDGRRLENAKGEV